MLGMLAEELYRCHFETIKQALKKGQFMTVWPLYKFLCSPPLRHILLLIYKLLQIVSKHLYNY